MSDELKACPFCGGIPKTSHRPESEASGGGHVAFVVCYCGGYASTAHQMGHAETVQAAIAEVVEKWNTRAQLTSQGGESVEVVGYGCEGQMEVLKHVPLTGGMKVSGREREKYSVPLMTVAQHQRILAAATHPADQVADDLTMVKVSRELLERAARHLNDWLELDQCECEGPHYCGRTQVAATNRQLRAILEAKYE